VYTQDDNDVDYVDAIVNEKLASDDVVHAKRPLTSKICFVPSSTTNYETRSLSITRLSGLRRRRHRPTRHPTVLCVCVVPWYSVQIEGPIRIIDSIVWSIDSPIHWPGRKCLSPKASRPFSPKLKRRMICQRRQTMNRTAKVWSSVAST